MSFVVNDHNTQQQQPFYGPLSGTTQVSRYQKKQAGWFLRPDCAPSSECPELRLLHVAAPPVQSEYPAKHRAATAVPLPELP